MVTIITGAKDSGKSSYLEAWYRKSPKGVGFFCRKVFQNGGFIGYDLIFLPGMVSCLFARIIGSEMEECSEEVIRQGRFLLAASAFNLAKNWMESHPVADGEPIWMDEIGALELSGQGFDRLFGESLAAKKEIRVVFREHIFDRLIAYYDIQDFKRIQL